jgi:hypothetical protein
MRNQRFAQFAKEAYQQAQGVTSAEVYRESEYTMGIEIRFTGGLTARHGITMVTPEGEDLAKPEEPVEGPPPAVRDERPQPRGAKERETAQLLAALLAATQHPEMKQVYAYDESNMHPGLGVIWHSGRKTHMLLK